MAVVVGVLVGRVTVVVGVCAETVAVVRGSSVKGVSVVGMGAGCPNRIPSP